MYARNKMRNILVHQVLSAPTDPMLLTARKGTRSSNLASEACSANCQCCQSAMHLRRNDSASGCSKSSISRQMRYRMRRIAQLFINLLGLAIFAAIVLHPRSTDAGKAVWLVREYETFRIGFTMIPRADIYVDIFSFCRPLDSHRASQYAQEGSDLYASFGQYLRSWRPRQRFPITAAWSRTRHASFGSGRHPSKRGQSKHAQSSRMGCSLCASNPLDH